MDTSVIRVNRLVQPTDRIDDVNHCRFLPLGAVREQAPAIPTVLAIEERAVPGLRSNNVQRQHPSSIRLIRYGRNRSKGAETRTAIEHAAGEFCIIPPCDLAYSIRCPYSPLPPC
jgi:hypothetical protein